MQVYQQHFPPLGVATHAYQDYRTVGNQYIPQPPQFPSQAMPFEMLYSQVVQKGAQPTQLMPSPMEAVITSTISSQRNPEIPLPPGTTIVSVQQAQDERMTSFGKLSKKQVKKLKKIREQETELFGRPVREIPEEPTVIPDINQVETIAAVASIASEIHA
jgi:hypothetical protein